MSLSAILQHESSEKVCMPLEKDWDNTCNLHQDIWSLSQSACLSLLYLVLSLGASLVLDKEDKCNSCQAILCGFTECLYRPRLPLSQFPDQSKRVICLDNMQMREIMTKVRIYIESGMKYQKGSVLLYNFGQTSTKGVNHFNLSKMESNKILWSQSVFIHLFIFVISVGRNSCFCDICLQNFAMQLCAFFSSSPCVKLLGPAKFAIARNCFAPRMTFVHVLIDFFFEKCSSQLIFI